MRTVRSILAVVLASASVLVSATVLTSCSVAQSGGRASAVAPTTAPPLSPGPIAELHAASDATRAAHGLAPLHPDPGLARAALAHALENAHRGVLDHGSPDPARATSADRVALAGVALVEIGENLARIPGSSVARRAVDGWLASPPHRRNLLDPDFTHVGFGVAQGPGGSYVVQLLGARPIERTVLDTWPEIRTTERWRLTVDGPAETTTMVFVDGQPQARTRLDEGGTTVHVGAPPRPARLVLGMSRAPGSYLPSDAGTLDRDAGWSRDVGAPFGPARISEASFEAVSEPGVEVRIAYRAGSDALRLLVDGRHRPDVVPQVQADGTWLRAWLPVAERSRSLSVGVLTDDRTIRVVERFTLGAGPTPALVPGRPSTATSEAP